MCKIAVFYHVFQANHWQEIISEQLDKINNSGLLTAANHLHIGINGDQKFKPLRSNNYGVSRNKNIDGEMDTLYDLYKFCKINPDYKVLYFHTKGATVWEQHKTNAIAWRRYLEYFNIENWRRCCDLLDSYDCVGTEWETDMTLGGNKFIAPCYAGTFWWANASYINTLDPEYLYRNNWGEGSRRWHCEFWIGTGNPNHYNFYSSHKNKYYEEVNFDEYKNFL